MRQTVESRFRAATFVLAVGASPRQAAPNGWRAGLIRQYDLFCAIIFLTCSRVGPSPRLIAHTYLYRYAGIGKSDVLVIVRIEQIVDACEDRRSPKPAKSHHKVGR